MSGVTDGVCYLSFLQFVVFMRSAYIAQLDLGICVQQYNRHTYHLSIAVEVFVSVASLRGHCCLILLVVPPHDVDCIFCLKCYQSLGWQTKVLSPCPASTACEQRKKAFRKSTRTHRRAQKWTIQPQLEDDDEEQLLAANDSSSSSSTSAEDEEEDNGGAEVSSQNRNCDDTAAATAANYSAACCSSVCGRSQDGPAVKDRHAETPCCSYAPRPEVNGELSFSAINSHLSILSTSVCVGVWLNREQKNTATFISVLDTHC